MTKQQAIRKLVALGVTEIVPDGKFSIWATVPVPGTDKSERGLFDPRDLLAELEERLEHA